MLNQIYHLIYNYPGLEPEEMMIDLEKLAVDLVNSGRLRIDANDASNCARILIPELGFSIAMSARELYDPKLQEFTTRILAAFWSSRLKDQRQVIEKVAYTVNLLKQELKKRVPIKEELEYKLARVLIQSAHPAVIKLLLWERVEIFVTYGYSIGEMLDIPTWHSSGDNSGMQSTDGLDSAIFVSCGGDPFGETAKEHPEYGDGHPALARMMVIAAQEIGHYSDIKRDRSGRQISRYSANFGATRADPKIASARLADIQNCHKFEKILFNNNMQKLINIEDSIKFYARFKAKFLHRRLLMLKYYFVKNLFIRRMYNQGYEFIKSASFANPYLGNYLKLILDDMRVNLDPKADVYKRDNKDHEEAIKCVEALARVPQQVIKFGKKVAKVIIPNLYQIYYQEVIPGCIVAYENMTGTKYKLSKQRAKPGLRYRFKKLWCKLRFKKY